MFIRKSKIERTESIGELPKGKVSISMKGEDIEGIWVAIDEENKVMYLLNHALMFYPMPSWGMELPLTRGIIDLHKYRGDSIDETDITVCEETYNHLKEFIGEDDLFDHKRYIEFQNSKSESKDD